jgi:hypothetical protein
MPVSANLDAELDKEWENKSLVEILEAPVSALSGVSDGDAEALQQPSTARPWVTSAATSPSARPSELPLSFYAKICRSPPTPPPAANSPAMHVHLK